MTRASRGSVNEKHIYLNSPPRLEDSEYLIFRLDAESIDNSGETKYRFTFTNDSSTLYIGVYYPGMLYIPDPANGDGLYIPCAMPGRGVELFSFYDKAINKLCWGIKGDSTNVSPGAFVIDADLFSNGEPEPT